MGLTDKIDGLGGSALRNPFAGQTAGLTALSTQVGGISATVDPELEEPDITAVQNKIDNELTPLKATLQAKIATVSTALTTQGSAKAASMLTDLPLMAAVTEGRAYVAAADELAAPVLDGNACGLDLAGAFGSLSEAALAAYDAELDAATATVAAAVDGALDLAGVEALIADLQGSLANLEALEDELQARIAAEVATIAGALDYIRKLAFVRWLEAKAADPCIQYLVGQMTDGSLLEVP